MPTPPPLPTTKPKTPSRISAANCIFVVAFFYTIIPVIVLMVDNANSPDSFGKIFLVVILLLAAAYWTAGILLYKKSRIGLYIWWPTSALVLLNFPLGTLVGALAYLHLSKPDAKADLR